MNLRELAGGAVGALLAPFTASVAFLRRARMFHPDGLVYRAQVTPLQSVGPLGALASRLEGDALVRLSSAWWRGGKEWLDALGLAVRFRGKAVGLGEPAWAGDQDLLAATIRSPLTMLLAPFTTLQHDYLANDYYCVSPFAVEGLGRAKLRLCALRHERHAPQPGDEGRTRANRLAHAVQSGQATLRLEVLQLPPAGTLGGMLRSALLGTAFDWRGRWLPVAELQLQASAAIDQAALRFSPFRNGRGISPIGFIHSLRAATYALSQSARPAHQKTPPRAA